MTQSMSEATIEALELSVRAYNSLKRAGFNRVGELVEAISDGLNLMKIRNCGSGSVREIQEHLFLFQYYSLPVSRRSEYLAEVVRINKKE